MSFIRSGSAPTRPLMQDNGRRLATGVMNSYIPNCPQSCEERHPVIFMRFLHIWRISLSIYYYFVDFIGGSLTSINNLLTFSP